ncbi:hypothetical protein GCM10009795_002160 [Nocardioides hankookensis]|uniref:alpha-amylase n=1 Tax=Nocardioides hankookensis TaxID=443157 RepID=A0ABW1LMU2_9ACTN
MLPSRWTRAAVVAVLTLLGSLLLVVGPAGSAGAASDKGLANGNIGCSGACPQMKMLWFDQNWKYLGAKKVNGGGYSIWLSPGTYHLQFVDQRPAYDISKFAPTDIKVTVRANALSNHNVKMRKGAFVTGTVVNGQGKPARGARLVAANRQQNSFETTANAKGQFAIGGLPQGKYSVFGWDKQKTWVNKSAWAGAVKPGKGRNIAVRLTKRAGSMTVYLFTPDGRMTTKSPVTVRSKATGQWWTATAKNGTAVFRGLYPGRYQLKFEGAGVWLPATLSVQKANVHSNKMAFGSVRLTKRGGWVTGTVVDNAQTDVDPRGIADVKVDLRTSTGDLLASTTTNANGNFTLSGPLTTRSGMSIVVTPQNGADSYGQGQQWCMFTTGSKAPVALTTGRQTAVGQVTLPRSTAEGQPDRCLVS